MHVYLIWNVWLLARARARVCTITSCIFLLHTKNPLSRIISIIIVIFRPKWKVQQIKKKK